MSVESVKLKIRLEPEGNDGISIDMLRDFFMAHQETLGIIIREEQKNGSIPELRLIDVYHGSWEFDFLVQGLQTVLPLTQSYLTKMATEVNDRLNGMDTFEQTETTTTTTTRKSRLPKRVTDRLAAPFLAGFIKSAEAFEDENPEPIYSISSEEVKPKLIEAEPISTPEPQTERGEPQELTGELRSIDWEKRTCRFFVELDGASKSYKCAIQDNAFLEEEVRNNLPVKIYATPVYRNSPLGEKIISILEATQINKLEV